MSGVLTRAAGTIKRWWNGLVYSPWQLLGLAPLVRCFDMMGWPRQRGDVQWLADVDDAQAVSSRNRDLGLLLSAIDARYLPVTRSGWLHIRGHGRREWAAYPGLASMLLPSPTNLGWMARTWFVLPSGS